MARIPLPTPETLTPEQRRVYDAVVAGPRGALRGPLRAALHRPELADKWQQLGELLRYRTSLPPHLSELAILVTARHCDCQLEWLIHAEMARKAGLAESIIEAIRTRRPIDTLDQAERDVFAYAEELNRANTVSDAIHRQVRERFGTVGVVELTALIGYYTMVAMTLNAHEIPLPDGVPNLNGSEPAACDACCVSPCQKPFQSSAAYGLATGNAASAARSPAARRLPARLGELPAASQTNATSRQRSVIPPVYFVAEARPMPTPATR